MVKATSASLWSVLLVTSIAAAGCADPNARYKQPLPRNTQPLLSAHGVLYAKGANAAPLKPTDRCITSAGHCPLPVTTETGLPCTCDSTDPEFTYGGTTGPIPPMPDWADPKMKRTN